MPQVLGLRHSAHGTSLSGPLFIQCWATVERQGRETVLFGAPQELACVVMLPSLGLGVPVPSKGRSAAWLKAVLEQWEILRTTSRGWGLLPFEDDCFPLGMANNHLGSLCLFGQVSLGAWILLLIGLPYASP